MGHTTTSAPNQKHLPLFEMPGRGSMCAMHRTEARKMMAHCHHTKSFSPETTEATRSASGTKLPMPVRIFIAKDTWALTHKLSRPRAFLRGESSYEKVDTH